MSCPFVAARLPGYACSRRCRGFECRWLSEQNRAALKTGPAADAAFQQVRTTNSLHQVLQEIRLADDGG
jgi:hypothetical protein